MSEKIPKYNEKFKELTELGLWPRHISPPEPQTLERMYNLDLDLYKREYHLSVPDDGNLDQIREEYHKESITRRKKKKEKKSQWNKTKKNQFVHLGKGVSSNLAYRDENIDKLKEFELPSIKDAKNLSKFLNLSIDQITTISYHRRTCSFSNYVEFTIPKKSGGERNISSPRPYLKNIQYIIKEKILDKITLPEHVTGFKKGISIFDNAYIHLKADKILNADINNFFPSIHYNRVRYLFKNIGYSGEIATVLALLTTKQHSKIVKIRDRKHYVLSEKRYLPQGAPTSPIISNLIALPMDRQIIKRIKILNCDYSRYADDITISTPKNSNLKAIISIIKRSVNMHGFELNPNKFKILGQGDRQEVTGLIINSGDVKIPRAWRRILRAKIYNFAINKTGDPLSLMASVSYLARTHPKQAKIYMEQIYSNIT